jgi:hypothetical protein
MPSRSLRDQIPDAHKWKDLKALYRDIHFKTEPSEALEHYAAETYGLGKKRLPQIQEFWRYHVAPATHRKAGTHLAPNIDEIVARIAQRSYEVFANIFDALEELEAIKKQGPQKPRYRSCLNVLRCVGDACQLFDELIAVLGQKSDLYPTQRRRERTLASALRTEIYFFKNDWSDYWSTQRKHVADYRHMLVHHGRPWLFFDGEEHVGWPMVLKAEHSRVQGHDPKWPKYHTWNEQRKMWEKDRSKFLPLPEACDKTCEEGITWLNRAYSRVNAKLDTVLADRKNFEEYKLLWGISD